MSKKISNKSKNEKATGQLTNEGMLKKFIELYGVGPVIKEQISDMTPDMAFSDFLGMLDDKGVTEYVQEMTLKELFGVNGEQRHSEPKVLKRNILKVLRESGAEMSVSEIGEHLGEASKYISIAIAALKKAGQVQSKGEKRTMKYFITGPKDK